MFVEVQETHIALPGPGTIRRWRREAPEGFQFALLGPREVGQEGFRDGKVVETALKMLSGVAKELEATTAVFVAPPEFAPPAPTRAAVSEFLTSVRKKFDRVDLRAPAGLGSRRVRRARGRRAGARRARSADARSLQGGGCLLPPARPGRSQVALRGSRDRAARRHRQKGRSTKKRRTFSPTSTCSPTRSASRKR